MSVTMSSANREPPPLLFGQRSPTPPTFASFPQSNPQSPHSPRSPRFPPPTRGEDADMSTSTALHTTQQPAPDDSEDSDMDGTNSSVTAGESQANEHIVSTSVGAHASLNDGTHDAMDTTPDGPGTIQVVTGLPGLAAATEHLSTHPQNDITPPPAVNANLVRVNSHGSSIDSSRDIPGRNSSPPPPPAPVQHLDLPSPRGEHTQIEEESSEDEDDDRPRWREIREDLSVPDEDELREIEAVGEVSALNHGFWENKTFVELNDPEFQTGPHGRFHWTVDRYNGTRENPNKEYVMRSPAANVGGYDWQIKFYPKGNDTEYLSVYVECLSVKRDRDRKDSGSSDEQPTDSADKVSINGPPQHSKDSDTQEYQETPLPLLTDKPIPKRPSVAAQVAVVLYNPNEPRVNYYKSCSHRFSPDSPDWGWTRFHCSYEEIHRRRHGQRQALLRKDTLAFTCYIRIIDDKTGCIWEHHSRANRWDSFAMTGLQGLCAPENFSHGGNIISAISSWMLLKPFRALLYSLKLPNPITEARKRPKPLLTALQRILYRMRTEVQPGCGPVDLEDIQEALEWYGVDNDLSKLDVIRIWEILRAKIELELESTPEAMKFSQLFGPERDRITNIPSYRAPVNLYGDVQNAVLAGWNSLSPVHGPPEILHIELERQFFDPSTRTMKKLTHKVKFLDVIDVHGTAYVFYGFIAHKDSLQSGSYHSVLRPSGPGGKWYGYFDGKDDNRVVCFTQKTVDIHEGGDSKAPVAYILLFVRADIASEVFSDEEPEWDVPDWLKNNPEQCRTDNTNEETLDFQVFDSRAFLEHQGPGTIDPSDPKWERSEYAHTIHLRASSTADDIRDVLACTLKGVQDPRQCKFWFLDHANGTSHRPNMPSSAAIEKIHPSGPIMMVQTTLDIWPERRLWVHVVDLSALPSPSQPSAEEVVSGERDQRTPSPPQLQVEPAPADVSIEDTLMSDPDDDDQDADEPTDGQLDVVIAEAAGIVAQAARHQPNATNAVPAARFNGGDTEMGNSEHVQSPPPPPEVDDNMAGPDRIINVFNHGTTREMDERTTTGYTTEIHFLNFGVPPPPAATPPVEDIYFFLKRYDHRIQSLEPVASALVKENDSIYKTVLSLLELPEDFRIHVYEEESPTTVTLLDSNITRSFSSARLRNGCILIAANHVSDSTRAQQASVGAFSSPPDYMVYATATRFAPKAPLKAHYTLDYFSSEWYTGSMIRGKMHGHGTRRYLNGAVYTGDFQLGKRHGHGQLTHANGDVYTGDFASDEPDGQGSYVEAATGNAYFGGWRSGRRFGEGVTHWRQAQEVERLCRICWEEAAEAAFYDCGHVVACLTCARQVDSCPVCRQRVLAAMKLYFGS